MMGCHASQWTGEGCVFSINSSPNPQLQWTELNETKSENTFKLKLGSYLKEQLLNKIYIWPYWKKNIPAQESAVLLQTKRGRNFEESMARNVVGWGTPYFGGCSPIRDWQWQQGLKSDYMVSWSHSFNINSPWVLREKVDGEKNGK